MNKILQAFYLKLIVSLGLVFCIHIFVLNLTTREPFANSIVLSYIINAALALLIFTGLYLLKKRYEDQLGFLFLAGSALKFVVFFVVFSPIYKADSEVNRLEFLAFFVPYLWCLLVETYSLSRWLNKAE